MILFILLMLLILGLLMVVIGFMVLSQVSFLLDELQVLLVAMMEVGCNVEL